MPSARFDRTPIGLRDLNAVRSIEASAALWRRCVAALHESSHRMAGSAAKERLKASAVDCCSCLRQQQFDGVAGRQTNPIVSCDPASIPGWRAPEFRALHGDRDPADLLVARTSPAASGARRISLMSATRATCWAATRMGRQDADRS